MRMGAVTQQPWYAGVTSAFSDPRGQLLHRQDFVWKPLTEVEYASASLHYSRLATGARG